MANFHRRRPRAATRSGYSTRAGNARFREINPAWMCWWPRWWEVVFHTRPNRRRGRVAEIKIMKGFDPDAVLWPVEKKPHQYYW